MAVRPAQRRIGDGLQQGRTLPGAMEHLESRLGAAEVSLSTDVLDRIDEIVPPGTTFNPADVDYDAPGLTDLALRRRSPGS
ncbi:hypothetical protein [Streptomyces shenzhenensis]|uniref:hypothetical protein n=1 Tax=Streptomyces shenzhenensis TaxID=943815 RepID=UPI0037DA6334